MTNVTDDDDDYSTDSQEMFPVPSFGTHKEAMTHMLRQHREAKLMCSCIIHYEDDRGNPHEAVVTGHREYIEFLVSEGKASPVVKDFHFVCHCTEFKAN